VYVIVLPSLLISPRNLPLAPVETAPAAGRDLLNGNVPR